MIIHMKQDKNILWFTLVEVLVAMTMFWLIIVSVLMIFTLSTQVALKTDMNREMQQNLKSVVETIADDVRKNGIARIGNWWTWIDLDTASPSQLYFTWDSIEIQSDVWIPHQYYLWDYRTMVPSFSWLKPTAYCGDIKNICVMLKQGIWPLSNGQISFTSLRYYVSNWDVRKLTIVAKARPAAKRWVRSSMIKDAEITFQTTISERILRVK